METLHKLVIFLPIMLVVCFLSTLVLPSVAQAQYYTGLCTPNYQQRCVGNSTYWYDSCGNQGSYVGSCGYNNYNNYNYNNYNNCTYHAYRLCVNNSNIYWYDSCGNQQDLYTSCYNGQVCNNQNQYGQCATYYINPVLPPVYPAYNPYSTKACFGNSVYWYDSLGAISGLYKNCNDNDPCTQDACSNIACTHVQISNCQTNPPIDSNKCGNGLCEPLLGETNANCPNDCRINTVNALSISFFSKQDSTSAQWQKAVQVGPDSQIYFMISLANNSTLAIDNVNVSANIPGEISSLGNLQLNGVALSGDIASGINIGSVAPTSTKSITFEGKTKEFFSAITNQATATNNVSLAGQAGTSQSDSISINFVPNQPGAAAAIADNPETPGFWEFFKQWYVWILGALALIFLFIIVFKRFSSEA